MKQPNVILIMLDQLRFDALGCTSQGLVETPAIDSLASMGTLFENAYTPAPSCIPARASLMTGQKPWHTGVLYTGNSAGPYKPGGVMGTSFAHTLPGELVKNGYHAEGVGKMHFFPQRSTLGFSHTILDESGREEDPRFVSDYKEWLLQNNPQCHGITDHGVHWNSYLARPFHLEEAYHPSVWTMNETLSYLEKRDPSVPFFLNVSFARPHSPYDPPQYFFDLYEQRKELPKPLEGGWDDAYASPGEEDSVNAWKGKRSPEIIHRARAGYYGSITHADYQIGRLITTLAKAGLLDDAAIIFTSDHGDMLGDHNLWRKTYPYEGSAHIPLIIKLPKGYRKERQQKRSRVPVSLYDILPTIFSITNTQIPTDCDGMNLVPFCYSDNDHHGRECVSIVHTNCYDKEMDYFALTDGKCKYIYHLRTGKEELFDLSKGPAEAPDDAEAQKEKTLHFRALATKELETWNNGTLQFVKDGLLIPVGDADIVSPHYLMRLSSSPFDWLKYPQKGRRP